MLRFYLGRTGLVGCTRGRRKEICLDPCFDCIAMQGLGGAEVCTVCHSSAAPCSSNRANYSVRCAQSGLRIVGFHAKEHIRRASRDACLMLMFHD